MSYASLAAAAILATVLSIATAAPGPLPAGWQAQGASPHSYEMGTEPQGGSQRNPAAFIKSKGASAGFGTLMQMVSAAEFVGKRVRFSANVRTDGVNDNAQLWMRVDGPMKGGRPEVLAFDNMKERPIKGTTGWTNYQVVLDVPEEAQAIGFGILLTRDGTAWMEQVKLEVVPTSVPVTAGAPTMPVYPRKPQNLDFTR